eukprot:3789758-Pleurochrysis_carterae.AAC.3
MRCARLGQDITLHQFVLILTGRIDVVNQFDLGLKLVLFGSALTLLTCMIAVLLMLILKATVVPRERRRPPCSVGVFKGLATLLLLLGLLASYEAFAPSLVVGAICLILASTFDEANLPEQQLLAWLFWFCGASCLLAQALWLLWFGAQPQLLKLLSDYLEHKDVSYFQRDASAISKLAGGFVEELGSGDEEVDLGGHVQDTTGDLLHLALTAASFVVLVIAMCVATAFKLGGALPAAAPLV